MPLYLPDDETFASFWPGDNPSLLAALQNVLRQEHSGYIYIWSREGAGRSHLLHAACAELSQRGDAVGYVPLDKRTWFVPEVLEGMEQLALVCIDNIECVAGDEPWEMAIFNLYNRILESGKTRLLITGDRPPRQLNLGLPDLASRLDWGQIYKLQPLSDEDKLQALQLRARPETSIQMLALEIVDQHLGLLAERNFVRLKKLTGCNDEDLRATQALICSLDPHPGSRHAVSDTRYVLPDVIVRKTRGHWTVSLNQEAMPRLRVNNLYASLLQQNRGQAGGLGGQLQDARWLIKNVQQRFDTILRVSQAIVDQQRQFFDHGDVAMRPLTLREIADQLELHESTVSRVTTQKYMATPRGVFELKYFFGSHVSTDTGGAASSTAIRALIRQLVEAEDRKKPLSDAKIAEVLGQQGIVVARRTIAKYRESLNIPPVSLRKSI